jgi:phosphoglycolate phosphatase-like HAD superfamily hydrolase
MRRALFDLDRTLLDLDSAFLTWAEEFAEAHGLGPDAVEALRVLDGLVAETPEQGPSRGDPTV